MTSLTIPNNKKSKEVTIVFPCEGINVTIFLRHCNQMIEEYHVPGYWRTGQLLVNTASDLFSDKVRDIVNFHEEADCFYDDSKCQEFINLLFERK